MRSITTLTATVLSAMAIGVGPVYAEDAATAAEIADLKARLRALEEQQAKAPAPAAQETASVPEWWKSIEFHGFSSLAYSWNFNEPGRSDDIFSATSENGYRVYDFKNNSFRLETVLLSLLKRAKNPGDLGFRLDMDFGSSYPRVNHAVGLFDDSNDIDLRQFYGSYMAPVGNGLLVDVGKFVTHMGLEPIDSWEAYNDNYSRSFFFGFGVPYTHVGMRLSYSINDQLSVMGMVANGWDKAKENNDGKAFGGQIAYKPLENAAFYFNYIASPEQDNEDGNWRHLAEIVWVTKPLPELTFSGSFDYGHEPNVPNIGHASWYDVQTVIKYDWTAQFATAFRAEMFYDEDGARLISNGTPAAIPNQQLWGLTFTPIYKVSDNFIVRPEVRWDHARQPVFLSADGGRHADQFTAALNAVFLF